MKIKIKDNKPDVFFFIRYVIVEIICVLVLAALILIITKDPFEYTLKRSAYVLSMAAIGFLGIEAFDSIVNNRWRIKRANEDYPVYSAFILIVINAIISQLIDTRERGFVMLFCPMVPWLYIILAGTIKRWWNSL
jgi:peptidoglycan/LPS O-acetylase OafA/YrhL